MILLDTNVLSEPFRPSPTSNVIAWLDAQPLETLYLSVITVAEMRTGVALLPDGKRKNLLHERLEQEIFPAFVGRILPFDLACTQNYADLIVKAKASGLVIASADGYIAAIAACHHFTVATRDTVPFSAAGLPVINPWEYKLHVLSKP